MEFYDNSLCLAEIVKIAVEGSTVHLHKNKLAFNGFPVRNQTV